MLNPNKSSDHFIFKILLVNFGGQKQFFLFKLSHIYIYIYTHTHTNEVFKKFQEGPRFPGL